MWSGHRLRRRPSYKGLEVSNPRTSRPRTTPVSHFQTVWTAPFTDQGEGDMSESVAGAAVPASVWSAQYTLSHQLNPRHSTRFHPRKHQLSRKHTTASHSQSTAHAHHHTPPSPPSTFPSSAHVDSTGRVAPLALEFPNILALNSVSS